MLHIRIFSFSLLLLTVLHCTAEPVRATNKLKRGDPAPSLALRTIDGQQVNTDEWKGQIGLYVFGATEHKNTRLAYGDLQDILDSPSLKEVKVQWLLILSKSSKPQESVVPESQKRKPNFICRDADRTAFGAYGVIVLPTVVIVGKDNRVVHAQAGYSSRWKDIVQDALRLAAGQISVEAFDKVLHGNSERPRTPDQLRAEHLGRLAVQLVRRGMTKEAEAKFKEAIAFDSDTTVAHLGLGDLLLQRQEYKEAAVHFKHVFDLQPGNSDAALGLATILAHGSVEDMVKSEKLILETLQRRPKKAKGHYLLGLIHERRGEIQDALNSYRRATEILLLRPQSD